MPLFSWAPTLAPMPCRQLSRLRSPVPDTHALGPPVSGWHPSLLRLTGLDTRFYRQFLSLLSLGKLTRPDSGTVGIGHLLSRCKAMSSNPTLICLHYLSYFSHFCFLFIRIIIELEFRNSIPYRNPHAELER
jgi:hypothetical protein